MHTSALPNPDRMAAYADRVFAALAGSLDVPPEAVRMAAAYLLLRTPATAWPHLRERAEAACAALPSDPGPIPTNAFPPG